MNKWTIPQQQGQYLPRKTKHGFPENRTQFEREQTCSNLFNFKGTTMIHLKITHLKKNKNMFQTFIRRPWRS